MKESLDVKDNSDVYYTGTYWNDFELVRRCINSRISGLPKLKWHEHFAARTGRKFRRALILNCGNGWVERELVEYGLIAEGVGLDCSSTLLEEADSAARSQGLPLTYIQGDINADAFPAFDFDLVVNHAAAHHIATIDGVFRQICRVLPEDGWFVSFDYVGPHRNQYGLEAWEEAWRVNQGLPARLRQEMTYPPIPVMLVVDPTEAIHSELIASTFHRYFTADEFVPLGGAVAYPLLTHNARIFAAEDGPERDKWLGEIMAADDAFLRDHPGSALFAYFAGKPNKSVLEQRELMAHLEAEEAQRERSAEERGGEYYPRTPLAEVTVAIAEQRAQASLVESRVRELDEELAAMRARRTYRQARRAIDSRWIRALRRRPLAVRVDRRVRKALRRENAHQSPVA